MRSLFLSALAASAFLMLTGCSDGTFGEEQVRQIITNGTKSLDGEQVMLTQDQVSCGEREDLWNIESQNEMLATGRLTSKGQALGFADDIRIGEQRFPYTQLRGQFALQVLHLNGIRDESAKVKVVDVKVGVVINHSCFSQPPVLMGVKKGQFSQDVVPRFQLALNSDWEYDRLLH